jgi:molecular chaperone GrpE
MNDHDDINIEADGAEEVGMSEEELEAAESREGTKVTKVKKELEVCKAERQEYMDGWQRAKADYVNVLKRGEEEKKAAQEKGTVKAAKAFIGVLDSLTRAEASGEVPEAFQAIAKQLHDAATSLGLVSFGSVGDAFDPNQYEALGQDPVEDILLDDTVTVVLEQGWRAGDTVIRAAKVRVGQAS